MVGRSGFSDDLCSRVMNQLGLMEGLSRETEEERAEVSCLHSSCVKFTLIKILLIQKSLQIWITLHHLVGISGDQDRIQSTKKRKGLWTDCGRLRQYVWCRNDNQVFLHDSSNFL